MLCQCNSLYHVTGIKLQRKRQNNDCCNRHYLCCLSCRHSKNPLYFSFLSNNIHDQYYTTCNCVINNKVPEICPVEHSKQCCGCQKLRHKKLFLPELFLFHVFKNQFCCPDFFHPCIQQCKNQKYKHDIYNMCMQIA